MKAYVTLKGLLMEKVSQTITPNDVAKAPYQQDIIKLYQNGLDRMLSVVVVDKKEFESYQPNTNVSVQVLMNSYVYNSKLADSITTLPKAV